MLSKAAIHLLGFIGDIEAPRGYGTIYGNNQGKLKKPLTSMTLDEVIAAGPGWAKAYKSSAAGRYQFMNATLKDLKKSEKLTGREVFDAELQDELAFVLLERRGYGPFINGFMDITEFGRRLAQEWASLPVLADCKGQHRQVKRGQSFYSGDALNKSLVSPEKVEAKLRHVLALAGEPAQAPKPSVHAVPASDPATPTNSGLWAALGRFFTALFGGKA